MPKHAPALKLDMPFDEAIKRALKVPPMPKPKKPKAKKKK
jgi:hypothetical protein